MGFIQQNKVFFLLLAVFLAAGLVGLFTSYQATQSRSQTVRQLSALEGRLQSLLAATPAPKPENLTRIEASLEEAQARLEDYLTRFSGSANLEGRDDAVVVLPRIQGLIVDYRRDFEGQGIKIAVDEAFGFARYQEEVEPPAVEAIPLLDKQLQILDPILKVLSLSGPERLIRVEREFVEGGDPNREGEGGKTTPREDIFRLERSASARVPGLVQTLAFRVSFTGYTDALRKFLNGLGRLEMPILVREVEVSQYREKAELQEEAGNGGDASPFSRMFGGGEAEAEVPKSTEIPIQTPIIENNLSEFTVILEFIELNLEEADLAMEGGMDAR